MHCSEQQFFKSEGKEIENKKLAKRGDKTSTILLSTRAVGKHLNKTHFFVVDIISLIVSLVRKWKILVIN